ncbi:MAG TPA: hypothetical protein VKA95_05280 [Nitrososphaeraceae archaeon]|nr:hypothetical protein [Nitrososphaeraceae archaeon]
MAQKHESYFFTKNIIVASYATRYFCKAVLRQACRNATNYRNINSKSILREVP